MRPLVLGYGFGILLSIVGACPNSDATPREELIPVLSHTLESHGPGSVAYLVVAIDPRADSWPRPSVSNVSRTLLPHNADTHRTCLRRTAQSLKLSTDSWTVGFLSPIRKSPFMEKIYPERWDSALQQWLRDARSDLGS
jgi:hypothetical protein